ncbi:CBM35 domain-containing protein [Paenibacillus swuensis]|uniref:CBM35 domain-containing protein n=1 Tax=Paenibacillus swuensis TaxID=1178515 RepID=UPI000838E931|nr:CBM35 domain-containing protein [Paenibacillus swuensis]
MKSLKKFWALTLTAVLSLSPLSAFADPGTGGSPALEPTSLSAEASYVRIKNQWKGNYLYESEGKVRYGYTAINDPASQWTLEEHNGAKRIRNRATGHLLHMQNETAPADITKPLEVTEVEESWTSDEWNVTEVAGQSGYVNIISTDYADPLVNVQTQDGFAQANNWAQPAWGSAVWQLETAYDQAPVRIVNQWKGTYLYEDAGKVKYGAPASNDTSSHWIVETTGDATKVTNRATGHVMDMRNVIAPENITAPLDVLGVESGASSQVWTLVEAAGQPGWMNFFSKDHPDRLINVQTQSGFATSNNWAQPGWGSALWKLEPASDEPPLPGGGGTEEPPASPYIRIKNDYLQLYLYEENGIVKYGNAGMTDEKAQWLVEDTDGKKRFKNKATGHYMNLEGVTGARDPLKASEISEGSVNGDWIVEDFQGFKLIRSSAGSSADGQYIHVENKLKHAQYGVIPREWGSPKWEFVPVTAIEPAPEQPIELPEGFIRVKSKGNGQYLYENQNNVILYGNIAADNATGHWQWETVDGVHLLKNRATGNYMSTENGMSYLETSKDLQAAGTKAQWVVERTVTQSTYVVRGQADGYTDAYIHVQDGLGFPQLELRSVENASVQWTFEAAPAEANVPEEEAEDASALTPVIAHTNYVQIRSSENGLYLAEQDGRLITRRATVYDGASHWLLEDQNGLRRLKNRLSGHYVSVDANGIISAVADGVGAGARWSFADYAGRQRFISNLGGKPGALNASGKLSAEGAAIRESTLWTLEPLAGSVRVEAEKAFATGGVRVRKERSGFTGQGYADGFSSVGANLIFSVNAQKTDEYAATLRYSNDKPQKLALYVNGLRVDELHFKGTKDAWDTMDVRLTLRAGMNTIFLQNEADNKGALAVDALTVHHAVNRDYRGATLPFTAYEAEHGATNGEVLKPNRTFKTFASEASGRQAVQLNQTGDYVEMKLAKSANFLTLRYILPDSEDGQGQDASLTMYVDGKEHGKLQLSSKYSWVYGKYPWSNYPADGDAHRFYDESHKFIGDVAAGATIRFQKNADDAAEYYVLDLAELEQVEGVYSKPKDYVSVTEFGAVGDDGKDDSDAVKAAIAEVQSHAGKKYAGVWIPSGTFELRQGPISVQNVTLRGAGMWYTQLLGAGFMGVGSNIRVYDLAIDVDVTARRDELREAAFDGTFGTGSVFQNIWIEHAKAGVWSVRSDEGVSTDGLYAGGLRIRNTYADGVNFSTGTKHSVVEQSHIRNSGDDSIAVWSSQPEGVSDQDATTDGNTVRFNTVQLPWLADNIAIFGGKDNTIQDNILSDTVGFGAGIAISTRFNPVPFSGTTVVERNTLIRTGGREHNWSQDFGAIWIFTGDKPIDSDIIVRNNQVTDSTYQGLYINGPHPINKSGEHRVLIQNLVIDGTGTWGTHVSNSVTGSVTVDNLIVRNTKVGKHFSTMGNNFTFRTADEPDVGVYYEAPAVPDSQVHRKHQGHKP